jgi:hypothetical protein
LKWNGSGRAREITRQLETSDIILLSGEIPGISIAELAVE